MSSGAAEASGLSGHPLSPTDRARVAEILRATDPSLSLRYERDARDREQGLDMARAMLTETHVREFSQDFRAKMSGFEELAKQMAEALRLNAEARKMEAENEARRFSSLWGPRGTLIAVLTVVLTNVAAIIGTLYAVGAGPAGP